MDPASTTIAFVGFAASIATLTGLLAHGLQQLWTLNDKLQHAPEEYRRLHIAVATLHALHASVQALLQDEGSNALPPLTLLSWRQNAEQMMKDLEAFDKVLEKCCPHDGQGTRRWDIKSRVKKYLNDGAISHWEGILNGHINKMTLFSTILNSFRTTGIQNDLQRLFSAREQDVQSVISALEAQTGSLRSEIQTISAAPKPPPYRERHEPSVGFSMGSPPSGKVKRKTVIERSLYMTWSIYRFPIGVLSIRKSRKVYIRSFDDKTYEEEISFTLQPPRWLTNRIVEVMFLLKTGELETTSFKGNLASSTWNDNATLARYVAGCNVTGMKRLFKEKKARPTDVLPSGRSLLHEAVLACVVGQPGSMSMLKFLIQAGADHGVRTLDGQTALLLCGKMMCRNDTGPDAAKMFNALFPVMNALITSGANPIEHGGPDGFSVLSYLFSHSIGLTRLQAVIKEHVDVLTIDELSQLDTWILATMARADTTFQAKLYGQLAEFRTAPELSTTLQQSLTIDQLSLPNQVDELRNADQQMRIQFMRSLCRQGSGAMIRPLVQAGIDVHEADDTGRTSYLGEAAACGNHDAAIALLDLGADINGGLEHTAQTQLLWRWLELGKSKQAIERIRTELPLLEELILAPGLNVWNSPELLDLSLFLPRPLNIACATILADAGFGLCLRARVDAAQAPYHRLKREKEKSGLHSTGYTELHAIVIENCPYRLDFLISRGAYLEDEDAAGCTALLAALELGRPEMVRRLVAAGAIIDRPSTVVSLSPREIVARNVAAKHPRAQSLHFQHRVGLSRTAADPVTLEEDMVCFEIIRNAPSKCRAVSGSTAGAAVLSRPSRTHKRGMTWLQGSLVEVKYRLYNAKQIDVRQSATIAFGLLVTAIAWIWFEAQSIIVRTIWRKQRRLGK